MSTPTIDTLWAAGFIGYMISLSLYGVTLGQTYYYFRTFPRDMLSLKLLVGSLCVADTLHVYWTSMSFWILLIKARTNTSLIDILPWQLIASTLMTYFLTFVAQMFNAFRLWRFSGRNTMLTGAILFLACVQIICGLVFTICSIVLGRVVIYNFQIASTSELVSSVLCDILITVSLVYYFRKSQPGYKSTENLIQRLTILTINMGLLGCLIASSQLVLYYSRRSVSTYMAPHLLIGKCYANSVLAIVNARHSFRRMIRPDNTLDRSVMFSSDSPSPQIASSE